MNNTTQIKVLTAAALLVFSVSLTAHAVSVTTGASEMNQQQTISDTLRYFDDINAQ